MIKKYILFYFAVVFFFSLYSYGLDLIFHKMDYGSTSGARSMFQYAAYFIIVCFPIALPLTLFYNYVCSNGFNHLSGKHIIRILFGVFAGFNIGLILRENGPNYYIGQWASLKNLILYPLIGLSVELLRILVNTKIRSNLLRQK